MEDNLDKLILASWVMFAIFSFAGAVVFSLRFLSFDKNNRQACKSSNNEYPTAISIQEALEWHTAALKKLGFDGVEVDILLSKKFNHTKNSMDNRPYKELTIISRLIDSIEQLQGEPVFTQEEQDTYGASVDDVHQMTLDSVRAQIRLFKLQGMNFSRELPDLTGKLESYNVILTRILKIMRDKLNLNEEQNLNSINQRLTSLKSCS